MSFFVKIDVNKLVMLAGKHNFSTKKKGLYREFHWHEFTEIEDMYLKGVDHAMSWQENTLRNSIWGWFLFADALLISTWKLRHKFIAISVNKICVLMLNKMFIRLAQMTELYMWTHDRTIHTSTSFTSEEDTFSVPAKVKTAVNIRNFILLLLVFHLLEKTFSC